MRKLLARSGGVVVALALVATMLLAGGRETGSVDLAPAADLGQFNPGNIISDAIFFDGTAMDAAGVQTFLNLKNMNCQAAADGTPCLKNYTQDTSDRAADDFCRGYGAAPHESAATIITKAAGSCGINPQVLLVMLQKEQGLVLASGSRLNPTRYQKAMGFACPDGAPCDSAYYGFQNQVYAAARQYKRYAANPTSFGYRAGRTSNVLYNPDAACGSSAVYIQNQATAGLYIYTPYQPNAAALAVGYGSGDGCSAYGNRNFWLYFTDWFGSTQLPGQSVWQPVGAFDTPTVANRVVSISGWAVDPDDINRTTTVHVYVDGQGVGILQADQYSAVTGGYQGYTVRLPLTAGTHNVCTYAINVGRGDNNTHLGCKAVDAGGALGNDPAGAVDAGVAGRAVTVSGWALDANALTSPLDVHVYVDGAGVAILRAGDAGAPTATVYPGAGDAHRFGTSLVVGPGRHEICAYGINVGAGTNNTHLGCRTVVVDPAAYNPEGAWEVMEVRNAKLVVAGWARDLDATSPLQVHVYVDGIGGAILLAGGPHAQVNGFGFEGTLSVGPGSHRVCVYAINAGPGTTNPQLGCRDVSVPASTFNPVGALESVTAVGGTVTVAGWASDPDTTGPIDVHVYADGQPRYPQTANQAHPTADGHGFKSTLVLSEGTHSVCIYAINVGNGTANPQVGCKSVAVTSNPVGALESVTAVGGTTTLSGWATDADTTGPVQVHVYVDGRAQFPMVADRPHATADGHGYSATMTLSEGQHSVCTYAINVGPGNTNPQLGCKTVTISSNPGGAQEQVTAIGTTATVSGWTVDPDAPSQALTVHVYADGRPQFAVLADQSNAASNGHGFIATLTLSPGTHSVCTYAINVGAGSSNTQLGCATVKVSANDPSGALDSVTASGTTVTATGWAVDPDAPTQALQVHVYVDGTPRTAVLADQAHATMGGHAYAAALTLTAGAHSVCTYAINVGAGSNNTHLGCRSVTVG
jgi:hypothetical protein